MQGAKETSVKSILLLDWYVLLHNASNLNNSLSCELCFHVKYK